jgi:hypothetical protein
VVNYVNAHQFTGFDQRSRYVNVFFARSKRTGRMIVREDDRVRVSQQSRFEDLTRVNETGGYAELGITAIIPS